MGFISKMIGAQAPSTQLSRPQNDSTVAGLKTPEQRSLNSLLTSDKFTWMDGDFKVATQNATALAKSGQLADPKSQEVLSAVFTRIADQRGGDVRSEDFINSMRRELANVVKDPSAPMEEKAAACNVWNDMRLHSGGWNPNPASAPGYDPSIDMPSPMSSFNPVWPPGASAGGWQAGGGGGGGGWQPR
jgi:hypothetical protein